MSKRGAGGGDPHRHEGEPGPGAEYGQCRTIRTYDGWLFKIRNDGGFPSDTATTAHDRPHFRRVDIHAVGGTVVADPNAPPSPASQAATTLRRALVPGTLPLALTPPSPRDVATPYRVRLVVRWDSPTVTQLSDAIPTQAEITVAWQSRALPVPGGSGNVTPTASQPPTGSGPEIFTFVGGWAYDPRTTATQFSLALNSTGDPDGLAMLTGDLAALNAVATAFALGPALLAGIQSGDVASGAARVAALVGAIGFAAAFGRDGKVIFHGVKVEWRQRAIDTVTGARFRLLCDYTAAIGFGFESVRYPDHGQQADQGPLPRCRDRDRQLKERLRRLRRHLRKRELRYRGSGSVDDQRPTRRADPRCGNARGLRQYMGRTGSDVRARPRRRENHRLYVAGDLFEQRAGNRIPRIFRIDRFARRGQR